MEWKDGGGVKVTLITLVSSEHIDTVAASKLNGEKMKDETNQFVFIEKLNERSGNESVESLQEGVDLRLDSASHPQLRHQLDVLRLKETYTFHIGVMETLVKPGWLARTIKHFTL